jgi:hypothetical protein
LADSVCVVVEPLPAIISVGGHKNSIAQSEHSAEWQIVVCRGSAHGQATGVKLDVTKTGLSKRHGQHVIRQFGL